VPDNVRQNDTFIQSLTTAPAVIEKMTPYQQAQIDLQKRKQRLAEKEALGITDYDITNDT
jgi:hypothetical protein